MLMLISDRAAWLTSLAARLHEQGVFLYVCHYGAAEFYCEQKDVGGVFLDGIPNIRKAVELCRSLRNTYPELPILLSAPKNTRPSAPVSSMVRTDEKDDPTEEILNFYRCSCGWRGEVLSTFSLTVTTDPAKTVYMGYPLPLSKGEHTILRCLFYQAPKPLTKEELSELCHPCTPRQFGNIAVLVGRINARAAEIDPRPLIACTRGQGYHLRQGIL